MDLHDPDPAVDAARQMLVQIEQEEDIIQICSDMFCHGAACNNQCGAALVLDLHVSSRSVFGHAAG